MMRILLVLTLIICVISINPSSQRRVAKLDEVQISLANNEVRSFVQKIDQHQSLTCMVSPEIQNNSSMFGQMDVQIVNKEQQTAKCNFKYSTNICVIEKCTSSITVKVRCLKQLCKTILSISQRALIPLGSNSHKMLTVPGEIYKIDKQKDRSLIQLNLQKSEVRLRQSDVKVYSNVHAFRLNQIQQIDTNKLFFGLKPIINEHDQYVYIEVEQPSISRQLRFSIITHEPFLKEGVTILDFIETYGRKSLNSYWYSGSFTNNIQTKVRVFAPKQNKSLPFSIKVTGRNLPTDLPPAISSLQLPSIAFNGHKFYDITFLTTKSRYLNYQFISFDLVIDQTPDLAIFVEISVSDVAVSSINIYDHVYFTTSPQEEIHFAVSPQVKYQILGQDKQISILTKAAQKYSVSLQTCSLHKGCAFLVKTQNRCQGCSFVFDIENEDVKNSIIYYEVKNNQIEAMIDLEQQMYFKYVMGPLSFSQIVVNSPNVMVYAQFQSYNRCKLPTPSCHEYVIHQQNPIIVPNYEKTNQTLIVNIVGLEKTSFKLRFIEEINGLQVKLGQKFSYLFDNQQKNITVNFITNKQTFKDTDQHLYFNLIAPLNSLLLTVHNFEGKQLQSQDGYVQFPKKMIIGDKFEIKISKGQEFLQQYVHMTLIITTADSGVKLDPSTTHYERYLPLAEKKFIMEYDPSMENTINIFTENLERTHSTMNLTIRDLNLDNADQEHKPFVQKVLSRDNQVVDLDFELQNLDVCQEINCELEIIIKSQSKEVLEQSINIIHEESVISLDDSIWGSYEINDLSTSNHFFFIPRQQGKSITILFSSQDKNIYIDYIIHNTKNSMNPQNWPWQRQSPHVEQIVNHLTGLTGFQEFKIEADNPQIKACWPYCVILINVNHLVNSPSANKDNQLIRTYKILVSSTIIQVPEEIRFQITMKAKEQNTMFIQLKNFQKSEELTFFTEYKLGRAHIIASLISKGVQYKLQYGDKDFVFNDIQTHLRMQLIKGAQNRNQLKADQTMLKITFIALSNLKLYFQFTSFIKNHYMLSMDDIQVCTLKEKQEMWYEFIPERDFSIKFYRSKGYPLFKIIICKEQSYIDCLSSHKKLLAVQVQQKQKTIQQTKKELENLQKKEIAIVSDDIKTTTGKDLELFVEKNFQYMGQQCQQCIVFIWVYAYAQELSLSINIRSSTSEIQLKQMAVINDRITFQSGSRKYLINTEPQMKTIVTFRIIQGQCIVEIFDNENLLHNQTYNRAKNDYADISIQALGLPSAHSQEPSQQDPLAQLTDIPSAVRESAILKGKHHILRRIHVKVTSIIQRPIEYLVSYSIGYSGVFLEDGVITQKNMIPNIPHIFYYHNTEKNSHPFLSLSSKVLPGYDIQHSKNEFEAKLFYYPDASNRQKKEEFRPQMPPKKNNNFNGQIVTHVYELPSIYELYQIQVYSTNYIKLTASLNHKEIVYLPIGFEYLVKLYPKENIYIMVDRPDSEYLELSIKKCDTSMPTLMYTNDAKEFQKGIYQTRQDIFNSYEKKLIKTKKSSKTVHLKLTGQDLVSSLFSITVMPASNQPESKNQKVKAGNNGLLSYTALDTNKIEIQFSPIVCETKQCTLPIANYYLLIATTIENIYGELYCAGNYVISQYKEKNQSKVIAILPSHFDKTKNVYRYVLTLDAQEQFLGVKARYTSNRRTHEVIYNPTEVTSFWKSFSKVSVGIILLFSFVLAIILTIVVVVSTKLARRGYKPIAESQ